MVSVKDATLLHHACIILLLLWLLNSFNCCHTVAYFLSFVYLYFVSFLIFVHEEYVIRLRKKLKFEAKIESDQERVFSDSETVRWLNHAIEKIWPVCLEEIVSQKILLPMVPWFLHKYKPWTVNAAEIQHLYLGSSPPVFTKMRVLQQSDGTDDLVLELGINFLSADDMSAILGVKLRKVLGFGMWAKSHLLDMHIEGKVLVGLKFLPCWPFIGRLRLCFAGPPYSQITVKPIFTHGLDVSKFPGIAGWIDNLMALVFEQTLVEPNMVVVDVKKFCSPLPENWFFVDAKEPIAHATVEILEAADMKPSNLNGLADPFVKGRLGPYRFRTKTQKKTLAPKWHEEFKIPICTWESPNILIIQVVDKDFFYNDIMGDCCVSIDEIRDGRRHEMWVPLKNINCGRLCLAVTVSECNKKRAEYSYDLKLLNEEFNFPKKGSLSRSSNISPKVD
ncbi:C2 domain-containing protein At1g53590-like isoform X1 [Primulina huaijiensis]|uniref:C2 domain-containing protein At1g53590-like isoform X1 n=3 Tax=Primulina huaijiensis TaxID=1492673 RepID=UPI003CC748DD